MEKEGMALLFFSLIAIILLLVALIRKSEMLLNCIMRGIMGTLIIYCINQVLIWENISCQVGINVYSVLASATLGFPGVILLFAIRALTLL